MQSRIRFWLVGSLAAALLVAALAVLAVVARNAGATLVVNALARNSETIGTALRIQIERALAIGIDLDHLVGVDDVLNAELLRHRELSFFALVAANGDVISLVGRDQATPAEREEMKRLLLIKDNVAVQDSSFRVAKMDVTDGLSGARKATLVIGFPANYIDKQVNAVVMDLVVAVLIALILVAEFLRYLSQRSALHAFSRFREFTQHLKNGDLGHRGQLQAMDPTGVLSQGMDDRLNTVRRTYQELVHRIEQSPAQLKECAAPLTLRLNEMARQYRLDADPKEVRNRSEDARLRMVVFLVALSEEICRPFFAVYASSLDGPLALSSEVLAGIPLTTFLLTWALSQPFGAALLRRYGASNCLVGAAGLTGLGLLATAATDSWAGLVGLRALTGFGFGCVLIFSQAIMLRIGRATGRARAMAEFVAAVVAAGICGPVIGGLLAVKFGTTFAFALAAACALAAILFAKGTSDAQTAGTSAKPFSVKATVAAMRHTRLLFLVVFSAIPGKITSTAVLLMLVPLATAELGESPAVAGRLLLLFFLGFFLTSGWAAKMSDRWNVRKPFIAVGGLVSALACLAGYAMDNIWGLFVVCSLLGLGQAWLSSPQIVLVTQMMEARRSAADSELALGVYRLIERFGGAMGPILAAFLIRQYGLRGAMLAFGVILAVGCLVTMAALWTYQEKTTVDLEIDDGAQAT
jgi:MFS family permease